MQSVLPAHSISSRPAKPTFTASATLRLMGAVIANHFRSLAHGSSLISFILSWLMFPIFQVITVGLLYYDNPELRAYGVIAGIVQALVIGMIFSDGEILDGQRMRGTLGNLFLAPCPRYIWLGAFQIAAFITTFVIMVVAVGTGVLLFDISLDVNVVSVIVVLVLTISCLWGISMMLGAIGVLARAANMISNLVFPIVTLLGGFMYPIDQMPDAVRIPARCLPFGYSSQAFVDAMRDGATLSEMKSDLFPLLGFAMVLPVLGIFAFQTVERAVRRMGYLDLA